MHVKDVMTRTVEVVAPRAALVDAAERMRALDIGVLPVMEGGRVIGMITDRDMTVRALARGLDSRTTKVREVMTPDVVFCHDDATVDEAAHLMSAYHIRRLIVLDRAGKLAGIVSLEDVTASAGAAAAETVEHVCSRPDRMRHGCRRILVALDGSKFAERVLPSVELFAESFGAAVTLLRVPASVEAEANALVGAVVLGPATASRDGEGEEVRKEAETYLSGIRQRLEAKGVAVTTDCPDGPASDAILRAACRHSVDLIAMTTHGRTGVDRMLFGSVAEEVLRHTPCPVLLVRAHEGA